jgi:hypothetical protein
MLPREFRRNRPAGVRSIFRRLSIRSILGGIVVAMGVLIILLAGFNLQSAIRRNRAAQRVVALATIDGQVLNALATMRVERATILGTLSGATQAEAPTIARIADFRAQSEASYGQAAALLADADTALRELTATFSRVRSAHDAMTALRSKADAMHTDKP